MTFLPTFIVIGPGRSGSTMLYESFKEHPEISMAKNIKETNFFNDNYEKGIEWYQHFFRDAQASKAIGEISNTYIYNRNIPGRIAKTLPNVKLISVLRNPFERLCSSIAFKQRVGELDSRLTFEEAIFRYPGLIDGNCYADLLQEYFEHFPKEQILITFYDDLLIDPEQFIKEIFCFIGVDDSFIPKVIDKRINPTARVRFPFFAFLIRFIADNLRRWRLYFLLDRVKNAQFIRWLLFKPVLLSATKLHFSEEIRVKLKDRFYPQIEWIEQVTDKDLSSWYQR